MPDVLGYRLKVGVVTPSVNTVVQPEMEELRPEGVTNHLSRIFTPNVVTQTDDSFDESVQVIDKGVSDAVASILTCEPDVIVLGVSMEAIYGDPYAGDAVRNRLRVRLGQPDLELVHAGAAIPAALRALGLESGAISVLGPYGRASPDVFRGEVRLFGTELRSPSLGQPRADCAQPARGHPGRIREARRRPTRRHRPVRS